MIQIYRRDYIYTKDELINIMRSFDALGPWLNSSLKRRMASDSLKSNKDQWSDLSIILELNMISGSIQVEVESVSSSGC